MLANLDGVHASKESRRYSTASHGFTPSNLRGWSWRSDDDGASRSSRRASAVDARTSSLQPVLDPKARPAVVVTTGTAGRGFVFKHDAVLPAAVTYAGQGSVASGTQPALRPRDEQYRKADRLSPMDEAEAMRSSADAVQEFAPTAQDVVPPSVVDTLVAQLVAMAHSDEEDEQEHNLRRSMSELTPMARRPSRQSSRTTPTQRSPNVPMAD